MQKNLSAIAHDGEALAAEPQRASVNETGKPGPAKHGVEVYDFSQQVLAAEDALHQPLFQDSFSSWSSVVLLLLCAAGWLMYLRSRFSTLSRRVRNDSGCSGTPEPAEPPKHQTPVVHYQRHYPHTHLMQNTKLPSQQGAARAIIYQSELDYISRCILDRPNIETGGQFFGFWNDQGVPIVMYAIGPGPRAGHQAAFFLQDIEYLEKVGNAILKKYGLMQIGEWHSHHQLGLAQPSGHDAQTMVDGVSSGPFRRLLLCIGNCDGRTSTVNAFIFQRENAHSYHKVPWEIKPINSPFRAIIDQDLSSELNHPLCRQARHGHLFITDRNPVKLSESVSSEFWLADKNNAQICKKIRDRLLAWDAWNVLRAEIKLDNSKQVHLFLHSESAERELIFPANFPNAAPRLILIPAENAPQEYTVSDWVFSGDIFDDVMQFCQQADSHIRSDIGGPGELPLSV